MIACCLLTADRFAYTVVTLRSFARHNDRSQFLLLHGDDASTDRDVPAIAQDYGFDTVVQSTHRVGWLEMRRNLFRAAQKRGAAWVLFLENDVEWVRPFPWPLFDYIKDIERIYCLRLHGEFKGKHQTDPCMTYHKADRRQPVRWKRIKYAPEPAQVGWIHWSAQPSVTRIDDLLRLHECGAESERLTVRVKDNVTYHIGAKRTTALAVSA